ncbi:hypothetical protein EF906_34595, partial [Streptomyces sp. WAC08241]
MPPGPGPGSTSRTSGTTTGRCPVRRTRLAGALTAVLTLALVATGCGNGSGEGGGGAPGTRSNPAAKSGSATESSPAGKSAAAPDRVEPLAAPAVPRLPVTVDSADGRKVTVTSTERIVPLSGSLSEIVFTLGLGDRVVARDITATFEQAEKLPVVTRAHDVSAESVLSLKPTLVVAEGTTGPAEAIAQIRDAGVP